MKYILCPLCGMNDYRIVFKIGSLNKKIINVICCKCGLVYVNPRQTEKEYEEFHRQNFFQEKGYESIEDFRKKASKSELDIKSRVVDLLLKYVDSKAKILDVGCGMGTIVNIFKKKGFDAKGIELSDIEIRVAREVYGLEIEHLSLEQYAQTNNEQFDLIILHHTLEHMPEPRKELARIYKLLKSNGLLYVGVPNIMNMKKRPEVFFEIGHALSFSPYSLKNLLNKCGFGIEYFSDKAAYLGGMDTVARKDVKNKKDLELELDKFEDSFCVRAYVLYKFFQYFIFRILRKFFLFFLSESAQIGIGRKIYLFIKKR